MKDYQLRSFILAADRRSFSKAASESFISPPALIQQINLLEQSLGFRLFIRSASGISLTKAGEMFYDSAQEIITILDESKEKGKAIERVARKTIRVGCSPEEIPPFLPQIYTLFCEAHPDINFEFVASANCSQVDDLIAGRIDICHMPKLTIIDQIGLDYIPLYTDEYYVCVAPDHSLASQELVRIEDLEGEKVYIDSAFVTEIQNQRMLKYIDEQNIGIELDTREFDKSLQMEILSHGGVLPAPGKYLYTVAPPLKAIKLDWDKPEYGFIARKCSEEAKDAYIAVAKDFFNKR